MPAKAGGRPGNRSAISGRIWPARRSAYVGLGRIGTALANRCHAGWDMSVLYYDLAPNLHAEAEFGARRVDLDELLRESDFVSVHAALTPENRHLIGAAQFKLMKSTAVFVNTARGPLVDQKALYEALKAGTIFAAGLDVTDPEPPADDDPLLRLPNAIVMRTSPARPTRPATAWPRFVPII